MCSAPTAAIVLNADDRSIIAPLPFPLPKPSRYDGMNLRQIMRDSTGGGGTPTSFPSPSPPPPSSSSSSSDFEFTICNAPSSKHSAADLCPADELFYKGQLLPLQLSPRLSMVRTLLASSSTSSSSDVNSTSRDSNGSTSSSSFSTETLLLHLPDCDSSRQSSANEEDACRRPIPSPAPKRGYLSSFTTRFSSVFLHRGNKKDPTVITNLPSTTSPSDILNIQIQIPSTGKKSTLSSSSAKEMLKKYVKKMKPLYEKISSLQHKHSQPQQTKKTVSFSIHREQVPSTKRAEERRPAAAGRTEFFANAHSFSWRKRSAASCPPSMRSSPTHSGLLSVSGAGPSRGCRNAEPPSALSSASSAEELNCAIQSAIAHCKSTMALANRRKAPTTVSSSVDDLCAPQTEETFM